MSICEGGEWGARGVDMCCVDMSILGEGRRGICVVDMSIGVDMCRRGMRNAACVDMSIWEEEEGGMCRYVSSKGETKCRMRRYDTNLNKNLYISHFI
jgi:hypothetical protein